MARNSYGEAIISEHAVAQMARRGISDGLLRAVLRKPEQVSDVRPGRVVLQSLVTMGDRRYLLRVFVDVDRSPAEVVTVYRTSKVERYWRGQ